jgi:hypothetical protein
MHALKPMITDQNPPLFSPQKNLNTSFSFISYLQRPSNVKERWRE